MSVKRSLASWLRKRPSLYHLVAEVYGTLKPVHLLELLIGTKAQERSWTKGHLGRDDYWGKSNNDWIRGFWDSRTHSHRPLLIERISSFSPASILEIGCNCGPNLCLLAKKFPDAEIIGVDINPLAVQKGNEWLSQENISNVKLLVGKADRLGQFQDKTFDVVFTDAVLIYIGGDKITEVTKGIIRIARRALVLMEWHSFKPKRKDSDGLGVYYEGHWKRDYVALLKQFVAEGQIHVTKIPDEVWPDSSWKEVGAVIEVKLSSGERA